MTDLQHFSAIETAGPAKRRRRAPLVIGAVAAAALAFGGASVAYAATDTASDSSSSSTDGAATDERPAHEPHMHGTVVSVSGSTITITDHDGFTRVINTSGDTAYTDDLTADLAAGTEIRATGTVNGDGTSLDATEVGTAPTPGDGEGPGDGGPLGDGERPTPPADGELPTDAPTPSSTDDAETTS
ncbi:hypothetical protein D6T64_03500 [Cryobacterium melibiosiphilum]|uniref:DUF5666 domain-containing protein n=1 Tax=Cryobacterium melibiosiphilum TaxID=995039 RepID=A0A3A5MNQ4_9MICO|nr:hypothetical protein [Cryobacterium melibiosiphilum]RJT90595.1 hypothetical protein D6T64_03500 [Cryobacterium melibiosiphilum]